MPLNFSLPYPPFIFPSKQLCPQAFRGCPPSIFSCLPGPCRSPSALWRLVCPPAVCFGSHLFSPLHVIFQNALSQPLDQFAPAWPHLPSHTGQITRCAWPPLSSPFSPLLSSLGDHSIPVLHPVPQPHQTLKGPCLCLATHPNVVPVTRIGNGRQTVANSDR